VRVLFGEHGRWGFRPGKGEKSHQNILVKLAPIDDGYLRDNAKSVRVLYIVGYRLKGSSTDGQTDRLKGVRVAMIECRLLCSENKKKKG